MPTTQDLLDATDAAILSVLENGQAIGSDGRQYTKASLPALLETKKTLQRQLAAEVPIGDRLRFGIKRRTDP